MTRRADPRPFIGGRQEPGDSAARNLSAPVSRWTLFIQSDLGTGRGSVRVDADEADYFAYWRRMREAGATPPLHDRMGIELVQLSPTTVITMELGEDVRGFAEGSVHGGMLATLADISCAVSLWRSFDRGTQIPITTDMHVRYYRQPKSGPLSAEATIVYRGTRLLSTECSVTDGDQRVLARATATYMIAAQPARPGTSTTPEVTAQ